jgi:pimeloyl-ACP methyl ester carboxylesterase
MHVDLPDGTRLWFDVDGPALVPDGAGMRQRPTVVVVHGGPASYDHSYLKPAFSRLTEVAQVVYLDLRGHGRSDWGDPDAWSFERCADDIRAFCDELGIERPVVLGHSMGGFVVMLYGAQHPGHPAALILHATNARFDLERLVEAVRRAAGDEVAEIARRDYGGGDDTVTKEEWARVFRAFGPVVPDDDELARRKQNPGLSARGAELLRTFDARAELARIECPTLVCVGELDAITPVKAAREIADAVRSDLVRLEVVPGGGHFTWKDAPDAYWAIVTEFVEDAYAKTRTSR